MKERYNKIEIASIELIIIYILALGIVISAICIHRKSVSYYSFVIELMEPQFKSTFEKLGLETEIIRHGLFSKTKTTKIVLQKFLHENINILNDTKAMFILLISCSMFFFALIFYTKLIKYELYFNIDLPYLSNKFIFLFIYFDNIITIMIAAMSAISIYLSMSSLINYITAQSLYDLNNGSKDKEKLRISGGVMMSSLSLIGSLSSITGLILYLK